jgi:hypothetical protein
VQAQGHNAIIERVEGLGRIWDAQHRAKRIDGRLPKIRPVVFACHREAKIECDWALRKRARDHFSTYVVYLLFPFRRLGGGGCTDPQLRLGNGPVGKMGLTDTNGGRSGMILVGENGVESISLEPAYDRKHVIVQVIAMADERNGSTESDAWLKGQMPIVTHRSGREALKFVQLMCQFQLIRVALRHPALEHRLPRKPKASRWVWASVEELLLRTL